MAVKRDGFKAESVRNWISQEGTELSSRMGLALKEIGEI
jgi:hypothetical protein